jgi:hypothetical protein
MAERDERAWRYFQLLDSQWLARVWVAFPRKPDQQMSATHRQYDFYRASLATVSVVVIRVICARRSGTEL